MHALSRHRHAWLTGICSAAVAFGFGSPASAGNQAWVGLEDMAQLLRDDARMIVMGDSYSVSWFFRVPPACLRVWPIPRITAMEGGPKQYHDLMRALALSNQVAAVESGDPEGLGYTVERQEPKPSFFALPVRGMREFHANEDMVLGYGNRLLEFRIQNYRFEPGVHGPFSNAGDNVKFRMLYRCTSDPALQLPSVSLQDYYGGLVPMDLLGNARGFLHLGEDPLVGRAPVPGQVNATLPDMDVNNDVAELLRVRVSTDPAFVGSDTYLDVAGGVYYHVDEQGQRLPGLYYSYLADDSWSYDGFCSNETATHAFDKRFSRSQLVHWLDATTIDPMQPVIFTWYIAPEALDYNEARKTFERMIDEMDTAGSEIGLDDVRHLLVIPHMYYFSNGHGYMLAQQEVAFELAHERENVAAASIYAATDGILFDGNPDAIQWLQERGFEDFEFGSLQADLVNFPISGTLLDSARVHPLGEEGAGFFAAVLGDLIREAGCPADFSPDGLINIQDLLLVLSHWNESGEMDLDGDGLINIGELLAVLDAWGECWPVQAPFAATH
ncbi:MAG: hypothetical protein VX908_03200 [Planctomycetota bacterium]|nr:hypothetical protein [Planctomycetota bacterium]